jgi:hypothetical protein
VFTPSQKGSIAESKVVAAAIELGITVLKPINEGLRYDLVFDVGSFEPSASGPYGAVMESSFPA